MQQAGAAGKWRISRLLGEFSEPSTEHIFREYVAPSTARELRVGITVWAALLLLFAWTDYADRGLSPEFALALLNRVVVVGVLAVFFVVLLRRPMVASNGAVLTVIEILAFTGFFSLYFLLSDEVRLWLIVVTAIMLLAIFVMLPNRVVFAALAAAYGIFGTLVTLVLSESPTAEQLVGVFMLLTLPAVLGIVVAYRFQVVRRREFAALMQAEENNLELQKEMERRRALEEELRHQARTDPLTGLANRRHYELSFNKELARARRHNTPLALCVMDLDYFKRVNDKYGHAAGDSALRTVADLCTSELRSIDLVGRLGGEELVIMLPHATAEEARVVVDRLREKLAGIDMVVDNNTFRITATFGVTELRREDKRIQDLLRRADRALYEGKAGGRNRVCVA